MNLAPAFNTTPADDEVQPGRVASTIPVTAASAVADFFDLPAEARGPGEFLKGNPQLGDFPEPEPVPSRVDCPPCSRLRTHSPAPGQVEVTGNFSQLAEAEAIAGLCRQFDLLMADGFHSLRTAAAELGRSPAFFSGVNSPYARWQRGGLAALLPARRAVPASRVLAVPVWFVPAGRFFYRFTNYRRSGGSVPEAVRRVISLPILPLGWTRQHAARFLVAIGQETLPECPADLREQILAREAAGRPLIPEKLAREIALPASVMQHARSPRNWALDHLTAPGSQRRHLTEDGRKIMAPGDWFGGDDATPGIAVCVPCNEVVTPCSQKFGVLLGRFQWLAYHDARTDKILGWDYVVRPRGSYRAEDILNGMSTVIRAHGVPRRGWQFEGGTFNSKLVQQAIKLLQCEHWRTYSPHQKAIESVFNRVWTRLAMQFPHADMGRYRGENEANCKLYEACKAGHQDPRKYFPTIDLIVRVFEEEVAAHNRRRISSEQYGAWVPDELFAEELGRQPLREFSADMAWIFSPYAVERKIQKMLVKCRVPMFEDFSVPFEFSAHWMPLHSGKNVRIHFNPREPQGAAKVVLLERSGNLAPGEILGDAQLIGETSGYIRLVMGWADDNQRAGYVARQRTAHFMRRVSRGIGQDGRVTIATDEQRDGLGTVARVERTAPVKESRAGHTPVNPDRFNPSLPAAEKVNAPSRRERLAELEAEEAKHFRY